MADGDPGLDRCLWPAAGGTAGVGTVASQTFGPVNFHYWSGCWSAGYLRAFGFVYGIAAFAYLAGLTFGAAIDVHGMITAQNGYPDAVACQSKGLSGAMGEQGLQRKDFACP